MPQQKVPARHRLRTFWVTLPLEAAPDHEPRVTGELLAPGDAPPARPLMVLLADDNEANRLVIGALLTADGHQVTAVEDGQAAVTAAQAGGFDVVLMDIQMPHLDGLEASRAIRNLAGAAAAVPILALTADPQMEESGEHLAAGMTGHLSKPVTRQTLRQALNPLAAKR